MASHTGLMEIKDGVKRSYIRWKRGITCGISKFDEFWRMFILKLTKL